MFVLTLIIGIGSVSVSSTAIDELGNSTDIKKISNMCWCWSYIKNLLKHLKSKQFQNIFIATEQIQKQSNS